MSEHGSHGGSPIDSPQGDPVHTALDRFLSAFPGGPTASVNVSLEEGLGRVTADDIAAVVDAPPYARSIIEGYLVHAHETASASETHPVSFTVTGSIPPGQPAPKDVLAHAAWEVTTGSAIPEGRFAVLKQFEVKRAGQQVATTRSVSEGANIEAQGCDLTRGSVVVARGTRLGPDEIGLLASQGLEAVSVSEPPIVGILASGNEVIPHGARLTPGAIWDCNTPALAAFIRQEGGIPKSYGIVRDDFDTFLRVLKAALPYCGMIVIAGGTAIGGRDFIADLISAAGSPGILVNGVPMRSGKPLIMGVVGAVPIVCVAGHPPEALRGFRLFGIPALARLLGRATPPSASSR